ncbi:MAG: hypothetical protein IT561_03035 [Alphaproteobacteria bacterium]|nr:hypothetical protein [Alphaproteobacteria bacterium]
MLPAYMAHENFSAQAEALRAAFEAHFADPMSHTADRHQVWNYWHVPGSYTYLRTTPEKVLPREPLLALFEEIRALAAARYGLTHVTWPYLSLYVAGCQQVLHNDARNGRMGYVYSLTRWDERRFLGGETLIFREGDYFGSGAITRPMASSGFYELVPARFNQLLLFDDRLPHAVPRLEGSMVPQEGRVVLHGHISEGPPLVEGGLPGGAVAAVLAAGEAALRAHVTQSATGLTGLVGARLEVGLDGAVAKVEILYDRLMPTGRDAGDPATAVAAVGGFLQALRFPRAAAPSTVTLAVPCGERIGG